MRGNGVVEFGRKMRIREEEDGMILVQVVLVPVKVPGAMIFGVSDKDFGVGVKMSMRCDKCCDGCFRWAELIWLNRGLEVGDDVVAIGNVPCWQWKWECHS